MRKVNNPQNFALALLISVVFLIALIFAITSSNSVKTLKAGTPEATVQEYLIAVTEGRNEDAANLFSSTSKCTVDDIDRAYIDQKAQISLDKTVLTNKDAAIVYVSIERNDGPLMSDPFTETQNFRLAKENQSWKILGIPWPLYECGMILK